MDKRCFYLYFNFNAGLLFLFIFVLLCINVGGAWGENSNLRYFGYYHGDMDFEKETHRGYVSNHIVAIGKLGNCNVVIFGIWPGWYVENPDKFYEKMHLAAKYKLKVLLNVYGIFFKWKQQQMQDNWQERWSNYKKLINGEVEDDIFGFYIDEPKQSGIKESQFRLATKCIRKDFPNKRLISVISVFSLRNNIPASYFEYCTGVGFDYYEGSWKKEDKIKRPEISYYALFDKFKKQIAVKKNIWLVPKAFLRTDFDSQNKAIDDIRHWYEIAQTDKQVIGILNFSYASYWAKYNPIGAAQLFDEQNRYYDEALKGVHIEIGKSIISNRE